MPAEQQDPGTMRIYTDPDMAQVKRLLLDNDLPTDDLEDCPQMRLFACGARGTTHAVIGLEVYPGVGLLRSLAVESTARGKGIASALVAHIETYAAQHGIERLYLLTTTAEPFFRERGYRLLPRTAAPEAIRGTREFSSLCPHDSAFMGKTLSLGQRSA